MIYNICNIICLFKMYNNNYININYTQLKVYKYSFKIIHL